MGADLYVRGIKVPIYGYEVSKRAGKNGYFRDCYNQSGLFYNIGLSWWELTRKYEKEGKIGVSEEGTPEKIAHDLKNEIDDTPYLKPEFVDEFAETVEQAFADSDVCKNPEYVEWMEVFRLFIKKAKKVGSGIKFSV